MTEKYGLFLCKCRGEVGNYIPLNTISEQYDSNDSIAFTYVSESLCDARERNIIDSIIKDKQPDGLIIAGCSPRYYEQYFRTVATEAGTNPGKVIFANIREQIAWVYKREPEEFLLKKSQLAIDVAVKSLEHSQNFIATDIDIKDSVAIIGAGVGGIQTALSISRSSPETKIHLIEKSPFIGGNQLTYSKAFPRDECSACAMSPLISELSTNPNVVIHDKSKVVNCVGRVGDYKLEILQFPRYVNEDCIVCGECSEVCPQEVFFDGGVSTRKAIHLPFQGTLPFRYNISESDIEYCRSECSQPCINACPVDAIKLVSLPQEKELNVGVIVIAIGAEVHTPQIAENAYAYGEEDVITLHQYEKILSASGRWNGDIKLISDPKKSIESIAFLLCVERAALGYCSKYCCLSTAAAIRQTVEKLPDTKIYVFYQDLFADSKFGDEYIKATRKLENVQWIRANPRNISTVNGNISVHVPVSGGNLELNIDLLVLATGFIPHKDTPYLRHIFGLDASIEGFFSEFDLLFSPVSTNDIGKFVIGASSGPKTIPETTISAYAAGSHIINLLNKKSINIPISITEVDPDLCSGCGICIKTCPYHANTIDLENNIAVVDITRCRGCGNCVTACPAKARDLIEFSDRAILSAIDLMGDTKINTNPEDPNMLAFLCNGCGYSTADNVGLSGAGATYSSNLSIIRVPCSGRVDVRQMMHALTKFDGVMIGACKLHSCQYSIGNFDAQKRVYLLQGTLEAANIDPERLKMEYYSPTEIDRFCDSIKQFEDKLREGKMKALKVIGGNSND